MISVALGGGFVNTELRELSDPRLFDFVDYVTLDAGERPVLALMEHLRGQRSIQRLVRTFVRTEGQAFSDPAHTAVGAARRKTLITSWESLCELY